MVAGDPRRFTGRRRSPPEKEACGLPSPVRTPSCGSTRRRTRSTTTIDVGEAPSAIAVGEHAVWVANSGDGTVSRIDPATNTVVETIDVGGSPAGIAVVRGFGLGDDPGSRAAYERGGPGRDGAVRPRSEDVSTDPALYPQQTDKQISYATCANLLNYPDKPAPAGTRLVPEVARSLPTRSADGRTYTFTIRKGFAFSPPLRERVTAETFRHSIERALDPRMHVGGNRLRRRHRGSPGVRLRQGKPRLRRRQCAVTGCRSRSSGPHRASSLGWRCPSSAPFP